MALVEGIFLWVSVSLPPVFAPEFVPGPLSVEPSSIAHSLYRIQASTEKISPAGMALNLAAGSFGDGTGFKRQHSIDSQLVIFRYSPPDGLHYRFRIQPLVALHLVITFHLGYDYQAFFTTDADRNRCATSLA